MQPVNTVRDYAGKEYAIQATITNEYELNGNQSISATILPSKVNQEYIEKMSELWTIIDHDGVEHKLVYFQRKGEGERQSVQIKGVPLFFDILDSARIYERYDEHMTAHLALTRIFAGTGFSFVLVDTFEAVQWEGFGDGESKLESFKRALDRYGMEFRVVGKVVYLHKLIGRDLNVQYRHRLNASNIQVEHDATKLWTYAKGYGNYGDGDGGDDWRNAKLIREYTSPLASVLGVRHTPPIKNGNITDKTVMDNKLKELVTESLKISVSADIHDLRNQNYPIAQPEVGDRVFLIDERINFNEEVRVADLSVTRDWRGNVIDLNITFGTPGLSKRYQARINTAINAIADAATGRRPLTSDLFDQTMKNAVTAIQNVHTELKTPTQGGIIAVDRNNPNKQVWLNSAGLMVSKTGGAGAEVAITGEGVVAEKIVGRTIIGVNLTSADNTGYFSVTGPSAEFMDMLTQRSLEMSPNGIYGRNADKTVRFQADRTLITSSALGTSLYNVYLGAQAGFEARVVDMAGIPGDGNAVNYSYLPLRASGFYGNYVEVNGVTPVQNLYLRPRSGGEVRITGANTTDVYYPLRAGAIHGSGFISTTSAAWIGADTTAHVVSKATALGQTSTPNYIDLIAKQMYSTAFITSTSNAYIGTDGELRVVNKGLSGIYRAIRGREFITDTSMRENKKDISLYTKDTLEVLRNLNAYQYRRKNDKPGAPLQLGLMIDEMPAEIRSETGDSFALYALGTFSIKASKDLLAEIDDLKGRMKKLEGTA